ncbi:MAG: AAA domain-containing protein, partial [Firmicutes bacterium]|nr:AAA domain-containing protein [Bacillota bacterium]
IEEIAHETGRYELFIGFPFVEGSIGREMIVRAPLLLFPATIHIENETTVTIEKKHNEPVQLNKVFLLAYAQRYKLNIDDLVTEFDNLAGFSDIDAVIAYLRKFRFKMGHPERKGIYNFSKVKEPWLGDPIDVKHYAIIGRFPLANAIYNDYRALENKRTTEAISELLESKEAKKIKKPSTDLYAMSSLDFSQEEAIEKLNQKGNMVIYGPPGTGKSQTIVNIITDALCKNKRVLVVSQKKAALDVVYNRLGILNERAMYINDPEKGKADFFARTKNAHHALIDKPSKTNGEHETKYREVRQSIKAEVGLLEDISDILFNSTPFGPSLQEMYVRSHSFGQSTFDRNLYKQLQANKKMMSFKFSELENIVRIITEKNKHGLYYKKQVLRLQNPLAAHIRSDLDVNTINAAKSLVTKALTKIHANHFDISKYPNARQLLAFFLEGHDLKPVIALVSKLEKKSHKEIATNFQNALKGIKEFVADYTPLEATLDKQGFAMLVEGLINENPSSLKMLKNALDNYVFIRGLNLNMHELSSSERGILDFCYESTKNQKEFTDAVSKIVSARTYHEVVITEEAKKGKLAKIMEYESIKNRILSLKSEQTQIVRKICIEMFKDKYISLYNSSPENKNFLYQINKDKNHWAIRKLMEIYGELMLTLFPCWLLSPESVSTIMPLTEGLFDLVLFDEASQVFIENTLPTIYRSKHIAVAGDAKQLRPTALFMRRYMGSDIDEADLNTQAALEVESLLDLATSRYNSVNLNYHYRSQHEELITFSNYAFYDCRLQVAPNLTKNLNNKPIERIKVDGRWIDKKNRVEAAEVIKLLKKIFRTRKNNETIGIITFNAEQESYIEDLIDKECRVDEKFREIISKEKSRKENGENVGLFVKNLENVQGDERDIIIFSIGYARNESGKVGLHFGPLNAEGGENRLNVAVTRAKKKIYVITSIEPEELNVENTKNAGPKIFRKYLEYARAVSAGKQKDVQAILEDFRPPSDQVQVRATTGVASELKTGLEKLGYTVEENLGSNNYKLSLAIYDKKLDRYLVGIELDDAAFKSSPSVIERDVFRSTFMESRGWAIMRVWSRDYWLNPQRVVDRIDKAAKKSSAALAKSLT